MSLFGSLLGDVEDEFFGSQMSHMRHMNNMMNSLLSDPFSMLGGGPLAIGGPRHGNSMMPFMPQMPPLNRLFGGGNCKLSAPPAAPSMAPTGSRRPATLCRIRALAPRRCLSKSSLSVEFTPAGHHIGERAHLIEREQNYYSGDAEERQEFINIDEEEAEEFDREFQTKAGAAQMRSREAIAGRRSPPRLALPVMSIAGLSSEEAAHCSARSRLAARRAPRPAASPLAASPLAATPHRARPSVRDVYGTAHPKRQRHKHHNRHRHTDN
ncbi:Myeloid leukemia factor [Papilio xuthus]|uniref:Myeloid leukemia factor n=1 Tax=Papilio xuthus TaxID=66420 RepID=A0A194Q435_PAPXU|nr:Myeloid leukemia factor [Papilio xuthus]